MIPNLSSWGWFFIILGVLDFSAGYLIMRESQSGCWLGIALSVISIIGWFTFMPSFPWWAAIAILVDVLVMYGLAVHGSELTV